MQHWTDVFYNKTVSWWRSFMDMLPEILLALLIFLVAVACGRLARRGVFRLVQRFSGKSSVARLFGVIVQLAVLLTGLFIALDILQLNKAVSSLLAGAGIIGIILGFAFQDITSNFISGVYIAIKKPFDIGHTIKTNDFIGNVEDIQLRSTTIRTFSGLHLMIPNRDIIQKPLINYSLTRERRIELEFFIDSATDLRAFQEAVMKAMAKLHYLFPGRDPEIYFNDFRENAIKVAVWYWIDNHAPPGYMVARHDAIFHIMDHLKEKDISLMVPMSLQQLNQQATN